MHSAEPEDRFPLLSLIALMSIVLIAAIINNSIVMLLSALLPTPLLVWQLFVAFEDWEDRRSAAIKTAATSTTNNAESPPTTAAAPQPTTI